MNEELHKKWADLHVEIVNKVIAFCKENNIKADELHLSADCLEPSIEYGEWHPSTDSVFALYERDKKTNQLKDVIFSA